ncbi:MAG: S1/P1 nuclease [Brumimicrobium sp.]|nr:S1/P1 nuclease [Brumimicrobium sp.]
MKKSFLILLINCIIIASSYTFAWGVTGHRVVAEVAQQHLNDKAQARINQILGGHPMAEIANWMDDIKSDPNPDWDTLSAYHYVTIPTGLTYEESNKNPRGDVIKGISIAIQKLKSGKLTPEMEVIYLKMLIHFLGDIHQPLHVGVGEDRGGNTISATWFGKKTNLHTIWDSDILDHKKYSYTELTSIVNCCATTEQVVKWQQDSIDTWVQENVALRKNIYTFDVNVKYWEYAYTYLNWEAMKLQLEKGGVRLAGILNEIYG